MNYYKPELLAPAGDMNSFRAAVNAGADSIYIGGKQYSARASALNFDIKEIEKAVDYSITRGVKTFVAVNTLYKENEIKGVIDYIAELYRAGVYAIIVQDIGLAKNIKKYFPEIKLHASTQMTIHDLAGVKFLENLGFDRVVLSRELTVEEIREIRAGTKIELETFIHGALCLSYSGQCLMSSMIGGRSGNRGRCAQPCRMRYEWCQDVRSSECQGVRVPGCQDARRSDNQRYDDYVGAVACPSPLKDDEKYLLSLKDICTLDILPELINAGINSFKIEGRMKRPEYVAGLVSIYRKYIDRYCQDARVPGSQNGEKNMIDICSTYVVGRGQGEGSYKVDPKDKKTLAQLFNRGNFSEGYYNCEKSRDMMSMIIPKNQGIEIGEVVRILGFQDSRDSGIQNAASFLDRAKKATFYKVQIKTLEPLNPGDGIQILNNDGTELGKLINKKIDANSTFEIFLEGKTDIGAKVYKTYDKKLEDSLKVYYEKDTRKSKINMKVEFKIGFPIRIELGDIEVLGDMVEQANKSPITREKLIEQLSKTGNTPFEIESFDIDMDNNAYMNISSINEIRRVALEKLQENIIEKNKSRRSPHTVIASVAWQSQSIFEGQMDRQSDGQTVRWSDGQKIMETSSYNEEEGVLQKKVGTKCQREITILVQTIDQALAAVEVSVKRIYLEFGLFTNEQILHITNKAHVNGIKVFVALPYILRKRNREKLINLINVIENSEVDGYLLRTYGEYYELIASKKIKVLDYTFNIYNNESINFWLEKGAENITISPELNIKEIKELIREQELIVYGKMPVMLIEQCIVKNILGNEACRAGMKLYGLKDEKGEVFDLVNRCDICLNILYNSKKLNVLDEIPKLNGKYFRLSLTDENYNESLCLIGDTITNIDGQTVRRSEQKQIKNYTRGHYFRGVE